MVFAKRYVCWALLCLLCWNPTFAGERSTSSNPFGWLFPDYAGIGGSFAREDFQKNLNFDDTGGIHLKLGFEFGRVVIFEATLDFLPSFEGSASGTREERDVLNFMGNVKLPLALSHPLFRPSLLFGMGTFYSTVDLKKVVGGSRVTQKNTAVGLSLKFGGALEILITEQIVVGCEGSFVQLISDDATTDDKVKFFLLTFWIAYRL